MNPYKRTIGSFGEKIAQDFLQNKGFHILERNFQTKLGEIDIIAKKDSKLHFIEVKTRKTLDKGLPYEAVTNFKINHIKKTLQVYLLKNNLKNSKLSLDVISIVLKGDNTVDSFNFYENIEL